MRVAGRIEWLVPKGGFVRTTLNAVLFPDSKKVRVAAGQKGTQKTSLHERRVRGVGSAIGQAALRVDFVEEGSGDGPGSTRPGSVINESIWDRPHILLSFI
jgi:hypothetical protein